MNTLSKLKIGIVTARFNDEVTSRLKEGAIKILREKYELKDNQILAVDVPGAVEIPLAAHHLFKAGVDGVVALGAVIRGETSHYDYVCQSVERGCSQVQLQWEKPVAFGVLTTDNDEQAMDRVGGKHGHKGEEAAEVVIEMIQLIEKLKQK